MATADANLRTQQSPPPAPDQPRPADAAGPGVVEPAEVVEPTEVVEAVERPVTLTWAEQEVVDALRRLARAQSDLADLDARAAEASAPTFEAADVERLEQLQSQLAQARAKAGGRFGKAAARERLGQLEQAEQLVLDRMGVADYREFRATIEAPPVEAVDPQVLAFARRELASAREAWLEVQALEVPPADPAGESDPTASTDPTEQAGKSGPAGESDRLASPAEFEDRGESGAGPRVEIDLTVPPHVGGDVA
jgi:hypothetical protein